jgi:hypothetical protein
MASLINASYPSYNYVANYSGAGSSIRSAGAIQNTEHRDTVAGLERAGKLALSQFGFISLPREVLFLQDERDAKIKGTRDSNIVASSNKSDLDEGRDLEKVDDHTDPFRKVEAIKARKNRQQNAATASEDGEDGRVKDEGETRVREAAVKTAPAPAEESRDVFVAANAAMPAPAETRHEPVRTEKKRETEKHAERASIVGAPVHVYAFIQSTTQAPAPSSDEPQPSVNVLA